MRFYVNLCPQRNALRGPASSQSPLRFGLPFGRPPCAPLLLLSQRKPLRWVSVGFPLSRQKWGKERPKGPCPLVNPSTFVTPYAVGLPQEVLRQPTFLQKVAVPALCSHGCFRLKLPAVALLHVAFVRSPMWLCKLNIRVATPPQERTDKRCTTAAVKRSCRFARGTALYARSLSGGKRIAAVPLEGVRRRREYPTRVRG